MHCEGSMKTCSLQERVIEEQHLKYVLGHIWGPCGEKSSCCLEMFPGESLFEKEAESLILQLIVSFSAC